MLLMKILKNKIEYLLIAVCNIISKKINYKKYRYFIILLIRYNSDFYCITK